MLSDKFNAAGIRYALIGGFALHAAGYVRATNDIDLLLNAEDTAAAKELLAASGYRLIHEDTNVLHFEAPPQLFGGLDIVLAQRKYTLNMLARASAGPHGIPAVRPEDIIGLKVQAIANAPSRRSRDLADIEWLIVTHRASLDLALVREYFELFGMSDELNRLLGEEHHA
ncbi:MAG: nucleotidyl transferase AbiEii/AbiGii toxin family protein [Candidatus Omnitrophica bacterium]|nr:nucleotidyl transferase AbiEii/AbiGii toxin family protein [Candidatus Omnitrophota bacterium]